MLTLSHPEQMFIKSLCKDGNRLDGRKADETRKITYSLNPYPQSAISIILFKGSTNVEIIIKYIETADTLLALDITKDSSSHIITQNNMNISFDFQPYVDKILHEHKIGCLIESRIICDDGNVKGAIYDGLNIMLKEFYVPDIHNLSREILVHGNIPAVKVFAVYEENYISDPNKNEELCADGMVYVFLMNQKMVGFEVESQKSIDPFVISNILGAFI